MLLIAISENCSLHANVKNVNRNRGVSSTQLQTHPHPRNWTRSLGGVADAKGGARSEKFRGESVGLFYENTATTYTDAPNLHTPRGSIKLQ